MLTLRTLVWADPWSAIYVNEQVTWPAASMSPVVRSEAILSLFSSSDAEELTGGGLTEAESSYGRLTVIEYR